MRALSIKQPYAELIMQGKKKEEYRSIPTNVRGKVYIYASMKPLEVNSYNYPIEDLPLGLIIGSVEVVDCKKTKNGFTWVLKNPKRLKRGRKPVKKPQPVWFYPF